MPSSAPKFIPSDARTTLISVTSYTDKNPRGTIFSLCFGEEYAFKSLTELLLRVDAMLNDIETSQAGSLNAAPGAKPPPAKRRHKALATFKLQVLFRQSADWQGNLVWVEGNSEAPFRSVFEMACLMDSVLTETSSGG